MQRHKGWKKQDFGSSIDLKGLRLEAGNLRKPSQLSRLEMVAVAIWSGTERRILRGTDSREFKEVQLIGLSH